MASHFTCTKCGNGFAIPRRRWKLRKRGHIKHLWCWKCKQRTPHKLRGQ